MVAFVGSVLISIALTLGVFWFAKRHPVGSGLTWGQAMLSATYVFFGLFWVYGVVPHQWLNWSENELGWRPDKLIGGPSTEGLGGYLPFNVSYQTLAHLGAVVVYGVYLGLHVTMWAVWQGRGDKAERKRKAIEERTTAYGRPLARKA